MMRDGVNITLVRNVERFAMVARYIMLFAITPFFLFKFVRFDRVDMIVVWSIILLHNLFVHWVLFAKRERLFVSWLNFAIYFLEANLVVYFTGGDESDAYILYFLVIIGLGAYRRRFGSTLAVALLFCVSYIIVLYVDMLNDALLHESVTNLVSRIAFLFMSGWLVGALSRQLRLSEESIREQADALGASEMTLRAILDNTAQPILVYDEREFIIEANERAREFLRLPREQLLGRRVRSFMFDDGTLPNKFAALRARGEYRGEQILVRDNGEERTVDFRVRSYIRDGQRFFVAVAHDITEQKNLQEATRLANAHLERLNRELRNVDQLKSNFLSTISQKLRSPLSAVLGFLEMLLQEELGELNVDQHNALQTCRRATLRVFRVVDEALTLTARDPVPNRRSTDRKPANED
ncbi:MAG: PAS domain S-box protein [FCB group bacterium]|jgi:PAS domain S-box-containing protein|nr:PAS domain S-box protein [FCB group bacterium]